MSSKKEKPSGSGKGTRKVNRADRRGRLPGRASCPVVVARLADFIWIAPLAPRILWRSDLHRPTAPPFRIEGLSDA
jgi:hypothetical protein